MKIVIDGRLYGWEHAGPGRYVKNIIDTLCKIDDKNNYTILLRKKYFDELNLPDNFKKLLFDVPHYTFSEQFRLPLILYKISPDLVHFPFFNVPILYFGKFVVTIHDLTMHFSKGGEATTRSYFKYLLWRLGYHVAFINAVYRSKKIIVPSNYIKEELTRFYRVNKGKITVTYEGVAESLKQISKADVLSEYNIKYPYFIYSGSAYPHKNLDMAIDAIKLLNKEVETKILFIITSPRSIFAERLLKLIKEKKAQAFVKYIGFVKDSELCTLFNKSLAFLYPTRSEGFGLPGLEAMQAKTLVLSSDIPVLREVYRENAFYFNPDDSKDLKEKMLKIINLPQNERVQRLKISFSFIQKYSWVETTQKTLKVYEFLH